MGDVEEEVFYDPVDNDECQQQQQGPERYESVYELHKAAYNNNVRHLQGLLQRMPQEQYAQLDLHGNTALHVAAMRGNTAAVEVLLEAGLPAKTRSSRGWTAFDEACAARAMEAARLLQRRELHDAKMTMKQKRAELLDSMRQMPDYSLQLKWQLGSSVPGLGMLLRKYAPHDTYTIWKVGDKLRVDGSLMGIDTKSIMPEWKRGHFSLIVDGSPEGIAAAAAAAEEAMAAARKAARQKQQRRQQQQAHWQSGSQQQEDQSEQQGSAEQQSEPQQEQRQGAATAAAGGSSREGSPAPEPLTPSGADAAAPDPQASSSSDIDGQQPQQQQFFDPDPGTSSAEGLPQQQQQYRGPRLLFLNHGKGSWVDLSADKKALKLEAEQEEEQELNLELMGAMERDMEKLRLKPRNFQFAPVKGWLGGDLTEKVEGWKCTVYEAAGKLLAVSTSKARLQLSPSATFEDYLAAEYAADTISETLIDPLTPSGIEAMSSSKDRSNKGSSSSTQGGDASNHSSSVSGPAGDPTGDAAAASSKGGKKWGRGSSSKGASKDEAAAAAAGASSNSGSGRVLKARCWMAQDFPMSLQQLLPLLDVIGNANKHMAKVGKFLAKYSQMEMFPVKLQVPLLLTVYALVSFKAFHLLQPGSGDSALAPDFFTVPSTYKRRLLQEVMEKAGRNAFGGGMYGGGMGGDEDEEEWGLGPGGDGWFFGGDEGAEYMEEGPSSSNGGQGGRDEAADRGYRVGSGLA